MKLGLLKSWPQIASEGTQFYPGNIFIPKTTPIHGANTTHIQEHKLGRPRVNFFAGGGTPYHPGAFVWLVKHVAWNSGLSICKEEVVCSIKA
eukprot:1155955-Pelagomonas_calceolata.AAC.2